MPAIPTTGLTCRRSPESAGQVAAGRSIAAAQCVIVGDTPKDLQCARANGMKCVLVGTGRYPVEELEYWRPDGCLADLSDTQAVVALLGEIVNNFRR